MTQPHADLRESIERKFASLTAGLLARKGEATPAMASFHDSPPRGPQSAPDGEDDAAAEQPDGAPALAPQASESSAAKRAAALEPNAEAEADAPKDERICAPECAEKTDDGAPRTPRRAAVTLRLTPHDFLRLRLASAELGQSGHDLLVKAMHAYLDEHGVERLEDCRCLRKTADRVAAAAAAAAE